MDVLFNPLLQRLYRRFYPTNVIVFLRIQQKMIMKRYRQQEKSYSLYRDLARNTEDIIHIF